MNTVKAIPITGIDVTAAPPSRTYAMDFETGTIIGTADAAAAVRQAIQKALMTERFLYPIYDNQYGSEIKACIFAGDSTREFMESEIVRAVEEALTGDKRILGIRDFDFNINGDSVFIKINVETIFGVLNKELLIGN